MTDSDEVVSASSSINPDTLAIIRNPPAAWESILPAMKLRDRVEDFEVEEVPKYLPCGIGEHLYLWIQKTDTSAAELISRLSRKLGVATRDIGVAGQKDRRAITRQFVSVPRSCESKLAEFTDDQIQILSISAHGNKLRTGHLSGNRFRIVLRPQENGSLGQGLQQMIAARAVEIQQTGFPNYYGPQRFGHDGNSLIDGISLLNTPGFAKRWNPQKRRFLKKMLPSAVQSGVFNLVLAERVASGKFYEPIEGDVVCSRDGIRPFLLSDASSELTGLVPMGPMPGGKMMAAESTAFDQETSAMKMIGLAPDDFLKAGSKTPGTRRRMVTFPRFEAVKVTAETVELHFELPSGSFATVLLSQFGHLIAEWDRSSR